MMNAIFVMKKAIGHEVVHKGKNIDKIEQKNGRKWININKKMSVNGDASIVIKLVI